jgi:hypothetical protein
MGCCVEFALSGALTNLEDYACSRYDHSYPYLVNNDPYLGDPKQRAFQFLSCSGAVAQDVLDKQIPALNNDQDAIMLSVGKLPNSWCLK